MSSLTIFSALPWRTSAFPIADLITNLPALLKWSYFHEADFRQLIEIIKRCAADFPFSPKPKIFAGEEEGIVTLTARQCEDLVWRVTDDIMVVFEDSPDDPVFAASAELSPVARRDGIFQKLRELLPLLQQYGPEILQLILLFTGRPTTEPARLSEAA